ncbi:hypothetical protein BASA60_005353 [Batrachochytrium salamandrivorans]|nr:hypothetical protein BASA60_005353 [Batrachochytrium salamandrivorans]
MACPKPINSTVSICRLSGTTTPIFLTRARQALHTALRVGVMQQASAVGSQERQCFAQSIVSHVQKSISLWVSERTRYTSVMFVPGAARARSSSTSRERDNRMYYGLSRDQIRKFARENRDRSSSIWIFRSVSAISGACDGRQLKSLLEAKVIYVCATHTTQLLVSYRSLDGQGTPALLLLISTSFAFKALPASITFFLLTRAASK